jgi:photosystem II stability/assembly factor-like uncharacterized protein
MKFVNDCSWKIWQLETSDGTMYRTNDSGTNWECLYGESWKPVYFEEKQRCIAAWRQYFHVDQ